MTIKVYKPSDAEISAAENWGVWEKEESEFPWEYDVQETCLILQGTAQVTSESGEIVNFSAGDMVIFPVGLKCVWKITKAIKKKYKFGV